MAFQINDGDHSVFYFNSARYHSTSGVGPENKKMGFPIWRWGTSKMADL
jgi:hypothetical protein